MPLESFRININFTGGVLRRMTPVTQLHELDTLAIGSVLCKHYGEPSESTTIKTFQESTKILDLQAPLVLTAGANRYSLDSRKLKSVLTIFESPEWLERRDKILYSDDIAFTAPLQGPGICVPVSSIRRTVSGNDGDNLTVIGQIWITHSRHRDTVITSLDIITGEPGDMLFSQTVDGPWLRTIRLDSIPDNLWFKRVLHVDSVAIRMVPNIAIVINSLTFA